MIMANLHVDLDTVEAEDDWAALYGQALWLERWRNRNHAELIASLFGTGESNPRISTKEAGRNLFGRRSF